jgi:hypothetical protein
MCRVLKRGHEMLEEELRTIGSQTRARTSVTEVIDCREAIGIMQDQIAELQSDNADLRAQIAADDLSFEGHRFPNPESFVVFVQNHIPGSYFGFCIDFISLLECYADRNRDTDVGMIQKHQMGKAGYRCGDDPETSDGKGGIQRHVVRPR